MSPSPLRLHFLLILFFVSVVFYSAASTDDAPVVEGQLGNVGITYTMSTPGLPPPNKVVAALLNANIRHVHLIQPYPDGVAAFAGSGIDLNMAVPNQFLPNVATNKSIAHDWLQKHVLPLYSQLNISSFLVGYHVLSNSSLSGMLVPALRNVHSACIDLGLKITVSTVLDFTSIAPPFPPSASQFNKSVAGPTKQVLDFLASTGAPVLIDLYPYNLYRSGTIPDVTTGFALFDAREVNFLTDSGTGQTYENLFDVMVDATINAVGKLGYDNLPVVVSGTGWPSEGDSNEPEASVLFAAEFNSRLVVLNTWGFGTPLRPKTAPKTFIYGLFDDPRNNGSESQRNWGIWRTDLTPKYGFKFSARSHSAIKIIPSKWMCILAASIPMILLWSLS